MNPDLPTGTLITPELFRAYFSDYTQDDTPGQPPSPDPEPFRLTCDYWKFTGQGGRKGIQRHPAVITNEE